MGALRKFLAVCCALFALQAQPAAAQLLLTGAGVYPVAAPVGGCVSGPTICLIYRGHLDDNTGRSLAGVYTFSSAAVGTASADRIVVVAFTANGSNASGGSFFTMTIGGVAATQAVASGGSGSRYCELWYAPVPTGTTATIAITVSGGASMTTNYMAVDYYTITSTTQTTYSSRSGASASQVTATSTTNVVTLPSGGAIITVGRESTFTTSAITGDAGLTVNTDYNQAVPFGSGMSTANLNGTAASHTVTLTNGSSTSLCMGSIAWGA